MKRLNPKTGKFYKLGDSRDEDNLLFRQYVKKRNGKSTIDKNGFYAEAWRTPEEIKKYREQCIINDKKRKEKKITKPRKINPVTGKEWIYGEQDSRGMYFVGYRDYGDNEGYPVMKFNSPDGYLRAKVNHAIRNFIRRCRKKDIPYDEDCLNADYLISIMPKDMVCPVLGEEMRFGIADDNGDYQSPSLDKIIPSKGYVRDNVVWISARANMIKHDATPEEVMKVAKWLNKQLKT